MSKTSAAIHEYGNNRKYAIARRRPPAAAIRVRKLNTNDIGTGLFFECGGHATAFLRKQRFRRGAGAVPRRREAQLRERAEEPRPCPSPCQGEGGRQRHAWSCPEAPTTRLAGLCAGHGRTCPRWHKPAALPGHATFLAATRNNLLHPKTGASTRLPRRTASSPQ